MTSNTPPPQLLLARLDEKTGADWVEVAQVLDALETRSRISPEGRLWVELLAEHLDKIGHPKTLGHLRKIRRAYRFYLAGLGALNAEVGTPDLGKVSLTSLEIAERLSKLNHEAGLQALSESLKGASPAEVKALYDQAKIEFADQLSPSQLAWKTKRKPATDRRPKSEASPSQPAAHSEFTAQASPFEQDASTPAVQAHKSRLLARCQTDPAFWWGMAEAHVQPFAPENLQDFLQRSGRGYVVISKDGHRILGGVSIFQTAGWSSQSWQELLERSCFHASFFDRYWVILDGPQAGAEQFWTVLGTLAVQNIAVASTELARTSEIRWSRCETATPCPDRRDIIVNALLRQRLGP